MKEHIGAAEIVAALGVALVGLGLAMVYVPLALIVLGVTFVAFAAWRL